MKPEEAIAHMEPELSSGIVLDVVPTGSDIYSSHLGTNTACLPLALNISSYFLLLTAKLTPNIE